MLDACVLLVLSYACESWTLKAEDMRKLNAFEMACYQKIMRICWKDMVSKKKDSWRFEQRINGYEQDHNQGTAAVLACTEDARQQADIDSDA
jgi:hypothetical protein